MGRRRDAALALLTLAMTTAVALALDAPVTPVGVGVGVVGAVLLEGLLSLRPESVRRVWDRRSVQLGAVLVVVVGGPVAAVLVGPWVLIALAAGLCAYLFVLGVVTVHRS